MKDPFPEKDGEDYVQIKVKYLRELLRMEAWAFESLEKISQDSLANLHEWYKEVAAMREHEG